MVVSGPTCAGNCSTADADGLFKTTQISYRFLFSPIDSGSQGVITYQAVNGDSSQVTQSVQLILRRIHACAFIY